MRKLVAILVLTALVVVAGGAAYALRARVTGSPAVVAQAPTGHADQRSGSDRPAPAQGGVNGGATSAAPAQCAGPLPERSRVVVTKLPTAKLGEWLSVKNAEGKEALRFRVDLVDTAHIGYAEEPGVRSPVVAALFTLRVENKSCEDLRWPLGKGGLWLSWTKPHPKDITHGWVSSAKGNTDWFGINIMENGKFNNDETVQGENETRWTLRHAFNGKTTLKELPNPLKPGQAGEAEIMIVNDDPYLRNSITIDGLYGDGRLFLALGGELSWGMIDLGRTKEWMDRTGFKLRY